MPLNLAIKFSLHLWYSVSLNLEIISKNFKDETDYEKVLEFCDKQGDDILDALGVPYIVKCLLRYARVKVAQGDYQAAQDMLEKSIKKNPKFDVDNAGD